MQPDSRLVQLVSWATCLLLGFVVMTTESVSAQQETPSHRLLPLPETGTGDLRQQMQLLQQLKAFIAPDSDRKQDAATPRNDRRKDSTAAPSGIEPEQLQQLQRLMQQFGGQLPDGISVPSLDQIPRQQLEQALGDPNVQQLMRKMLEQYSRDRVLPPAGGSLQSGGIPMPAAPGTQQQRNERPQHPPERGSRPDRQSSPRVDEPQDGSNLNPSRSGRQNGLSRNSEQNASRPPGAVPQDDAEDLQQRQQALQDLQQLWERLNGQPSNDRSTTADADPESQDAADETPAAKGLPNPQIFDSVEQFQEQPRARNRPGSSQSSQPTPNPSRVPAESKSTAENLRKGVIAPKTAARPEKQQVPDESTDIDVKQELARSGLRGTLQKLVQQAKKGNAVAKADAASAPTADEPNAASKSLSSKLEDSLLRALDDVRQEVVQMAEDRKSSARSADQSNGLRKGTTPAQRSLAQGNEMPENTRHSDRQSNPAEADHESSLPADGIRKLATELFSGLAKTPGSSSNMGGPTTSASADPEAFGPESVGSWIFAAAIPLILLAAICLIAILALRRSQTQLYSQHAGAVGFAHPVRAGSIRTREDVIRAFHYFVGESFGLTQVWWTHRAAANQIATATPATKSAIHALADVYEQARYLPPETEFPPDQILLAKRALEQCESCTV